jgi:DNA-binding CsgD family transcriptional regulator
MTSAESFLSYTAIAASFHDPMGESTSLRAKDYRALFQLIGECRDLGADPLAWRLHLLQGACQLTSAVAGISTEAEGFFHEPDFRILLNVYTGFDDVARRLHQHYLAEQGFCRFDQPFQRYVQIHRTLTTRSHEQLIQRDQWHRSVLFNEYFRPSRFNDRMLSGYRVQRTAGFGRSSHDCFGLLRALSDPPFTQRDRRLMRLLHREIATMIGRKLASADEPSAMGLSPQRRQVLNCLLEGMSEKQAAARLGLTPQSVHQYVKAIYGHFRVNSRAELMARWIRFS